MQDLALEKQINIEELNEVLEGIGETHSPQTLEQLSNEFEYLASKQGVTSAELFDLAETFQIDPSLCRKVIHLYHRIQELRSSLNSQHGKK